MKARDITKLPQWAQQQISRLESDVAYWKAKWDRADSGDTNTWIWNGMPEDDMPLPPDSRIRFQLHESRDGDVTVMVRDGKLEINGGRRMKVLPMSSNLIEVEVGPL